MRVRPRAAAIDPTARPMDGSERIALGADAPVAVRRRVSSRSGIRVSWFRKPPPQNAETAHTSEEGRPVLILDQCLLYQTSEGKGTNSNEKKLSESGRAHHMRGAAAGRCDQGAGAQMGRPNAG